eukprot:TRINITY_DN78948_c0_g1_i1.p2 TRINITY_DN78948_c0_g1~~TRINITY_DN78948_c0_g1_i1.p2  ORF type:complete len:246 (-),score=75.09 TRINITY_DN78948_c0_g1_i1:58-795(-)
MSDDEKKQEVAAGNGLVYLVLGATGFTGKHVLSQLLEDADCKEVIVLSRRELPEHAKQKTLVLKDFIDDLDTVKDRFEGIDVVVCATGMPSQSAKSEAEYVRVEYEMPLAVARAVHEKSPNAHFVFCSGGGASENSGALFGRTKARTERDLTQVGFPRLSIVRPAGIMDSTQKHRYWVYNVTASLSCVIPDSLKIEAAQVAQTMILLSKHSNETLGEPDQLISTETCVAPIYESVNMKSLLVKYK